MPKRIFDATRLRNLGVFVGILGLSAGLLKLSAEAGDANHRGRTVTLIQESTDCAPLSGDLDITGVGDGGGSPSGRSLILFSVREADMDNRAIIGNRRFTAQYLHFAGIEAFPSLNATDDLVLGEYDANSGEHFIGIAPDTDITGAQTVTISWTGEATHDNGTLFSSSEKIIGQTICGAISYVVRPDGAIEGAHFDNPANAGHFRVLD